MWATNCLLGRAKQRDKQHHQNRPSQRQNYESGELRTHATNYAFLNNTPPHGGKARTPNKPLTNAQNRPPQNENATSDPNPKHFIYNHLHTNYDVQKHIKGKNAIHLEIFSKPPQKNNDWGLASFFVSVGFITALAKKEKPTGTKKLATNFGVVCS